MAAASKASSSVKSSPTTTGRPDTNGGSAMKARTTSPLCRPGARNSRTIEPRWTSRPWRAAASAAKRSTAPSASGPRENGWRRRRVSAPPAGHATGQNRSLRGSLRRLFPVCRRSSRRPSPNRRSRPWEPAIGSEGISRCPARSASDRPLITARRPSRRVCRSSRQVAKAGNIDPIRPGCEVDQRAVKVEKERCARQEGAGR